MVDHNKEKEMQLMRMMLVAAQTVIIVNNVQETTVAGPMPISFDNAAQTFEGWGTSLAWFGEYVGTLDGRVICLHCAMSKCREPFTYTYLLYTELDQLLNNDVRLADSQQDLVADLLFDHDAGLGLEIVRYNIGASSTDPAAISSMRPGGAVPSLLLPNGTYNWTLVNCFCNNAWS